ncbi:MAG: DUF4398 domain-containing protein [Proteobacteria bacterium]|nr:DUF4398 domain-containing protein [Pseudomonadota bacterium]
MTLALAVSLGGCASEGPAPTDELARARAVVQQADKASAQRYAAADLQRAHEELQSAERLNGQKKFDEARRAALAASADANLAIARGSAGEAQQAAQEIAKSNDTLRQEANRPAAAPPTN